MKPRFELPLGDGDDGACQLLCPLCHNSETRLTRAVPCDDGLVINIANQCGHNWRLVLEHHDGELLIEARP